MTDIQFCTEKLIHFLYFKTACMRACANIFACALAATYLKEVTQLTFCKAKIKGVPLLSNIISQMLCKHCIYNIFERNGTT